MLFQWKNLLKYFQIFSNVMVNSTERIQRFQFFESFGIGTIGFIIIITLRSVIIKIIIVIFAVGFIVIMVTVIVWFVIIIVRIDNNDIVNTLNFVAIKVFVNIILLAY